MIVSDKCREKLWTIDLSKTVYEEDLKAIGMNLAYIITLANNLGIDKHIIELKGKLKIHK